MTENKLWTIVIPNWRPILANELVGVHRMKASRLKKEDTMMIRAYANLLSDREIFLRVAVPVGFYLVEQVREVKRRVTIAIQYPQSRKRCDPDAPLKSTLDALKTAGLIYDDRKEWCDWRKPDITSGKRLQTIITLQDV